MIEAVLFDFGGVILTSPFETFADYEIETGLPQDTIRTLNSTNPDTNAWAKFERREINPEEFIELLVNNLNLKKIIVGYNHKFGKNRSADINSLKNFGFKYSFEVIEIKAFEIEDIKISSTKIRDSIESGEIDKCNSFLGYNFNIKGKVVKGKSIGKVIGFPTANIVLEEDYKIIPKNGVYLIKSIIENEKLYGMMNIGFNPTFGINKKTIEVNLFNYDKDLYGTTLKVQLIKFIRDEIKFSDVEELQNQLKSDRENCIDYINSTYNN